MACMATNTAKIDESVESRLRKRRGTRGTKSHRSRRRDQREQKNEGGKKREGATQEKNETGASTLVDVLICKLTLRGLLPPLCGTFNLSTNILASPLREAWISHCNGCFQACPRARASISTGMTGVGHREIRHVLPTVCGPRVAKRALARS